MMESEIRNQPEESIDDGLGILVRYKKLYHGSATPGIKNLNSAEETTLGDGVYLIPQQSDAAGYATRRARDRKGKPVVYEVLVENLKLLDLRKNENVKRIMPGFTSILSTELKKADLPWYKIKTLNQALESIQKGVDLNNIREIAFAHGELFTNYLKGLGYEGLIGMEGGEGPEIGNHETYLIFDPEKAKVTGEHDL